MSKKVILAVVAAIALVVGAILGVNITVSEVSVGRAAPTAIDTDSGSDTGK